MGEQVGSRGSLKHLVALNMLVLWQFGPVCVDRVHFDLPGVGDPQCGLGWENLPSSRAGFCYLPTVGPQTNNLSL